MEWNLWIKRDIPSFLKMGKTKLQCLGMHSWLLKLKEMQGSDCNKCWVMLLWGREEIVVVIGPTEWLFGWLAKYYFLTWVVLQQFPLY